ncbi:carboxypeptidase-like regulatory domain-containing protein [Inquilinus sp. KBS0705]|nr:carboxypeptidase-like regulatory domain-containing protein [Inquilinus sp. KBS0705]
MKKKELLKGYCFLLLFVLFTSNICLGGQVVTISGTVSDDKGPLPGATVFLTNTTFMTATDLSGNFKFSNVPVGNYSLIVKMMGFSPFLKSLMVGDKDVSLNIVLKTNTQQLSEVVIKPDKEWFKNLEIFKTQFLGQTANAKQCRILNAEILTLDYDKDRHLLKANSSELLKIENKALGYKITYLLTDFEYDSKKNTVVYSGYPSFEMMKGTEEEEATWKERRDKAYSGSIQHFITSLYNNTYKQQGFLVFELNQWTRGGYAYHNTKDSLYRKKRIEPDTLITALNTNYKKLDFKRPLFVLYQRKHEEPQYQADGYSLSQLFDDKRLVDGQSSIINLLASSVTIDSKGAFYKPQDLFFEGYMGWQKVADLTPFGFAN